MSHPENKPRTVISFLGTQLDAGMGNGRWQKWRPNIDIARYPNTQIQRLELFYAEKYRTLAEQVERDIYETDSSIIVNLVPMELVNPWDFSEVYTALHSWAATYPFDNENKEYWIHITTGTHVAQICLFLLVESRQIPGLLLQTVPPRKQRRGADGMAEIGSYEVIDLDLARYDVLAERLAAARDDAVLYLKSGIATRNVSFNHMIAEIEQVALNSPSPILLTGPTGAGKSMLAKRIYELKKARRQVKGNFIDVNCATLRGDGAASTLFGHKKGAFTGAVEKRDGYLKRADGGVLFLDEIGELGLDEQAMLLKALEEKLFYPVGSDQEVTSHFQLIAGTNRDLRDEVRIGRFREDLFARINIWNYQLPALVARREDIEPNIAHQLAIASQELGRSTRFNKEAHAAYLKFALSPQALWRGNFRDLAASIMRLATLAPQGRIHIDLVNAEISRLQWLWQDNMTPSTEKLPACINTDSIDLFERLQLDAVLVVCRQHKNMAEAGRALFNISREQRSVTNDSDRLRKYLHKYGLRWSDIENVNVSNKK
ncbi:MAG: RNA repair transcriptional activator RtcR [Cardiobacteriaceae bacterium]|nr:RNA repair transcriptional activator RtcR [Cardiobacteriaceae bacterium]